jgi:hypothetical protein
VLLVAAFLTGYAAFTCFYSATLRDRSITHRRILRIAAIALLIATYGLCILSNGPGFGTLLWTLLICASAIAVSLTKAYRSV